MNCPLETEGATFLVKKPFGIVLPYISGTNASRLEDRFSIPLSHVCSVIPQIKTQSNPLVLPSTSSLLSRTLTVNSRDTEPYRWRVGSIFFLLLELLEHFFPFFKQFFHSKVHSDSVLPELASHSAHHHCLFVPPATQPCLITTNKLAHNDGAWCTPHKLPPPWVTRTGFHLDLWVTTHCFGHNKSSLAWLIPSGIGHAGPLAWVTYNISLEGIPFLHT